MITDSRNNCREFNDKTFNSFFYNILSPFLGRLTLLSMLPAFLYSCTDAAEEIIPCPYIQNHIGPLSMDTDKVQSLDIFIFKNDPLQRIECYQRFDDMSGWEGSVVSGRGGRIVTAVANSPYERQKWYSLVSRHHLGDITLNLEDERREIPFMSGEKLIDTEKYGIDMNKDFELKAFSSEGHLRSICCDFKGKAYEGEKLSDVKVYLTNVNAECGILEDEGAPPRRIINAGGLNEDDLESFIEPDLIMQKISFDIGSDVMYPGIRLKCYQSNHPEETPGTPFTRLVIEGKISGSTYYWPVNINRGTDEEAGIWRNRQYTYDVTITIKGSADPDIPVKTEEIIINQEVSEWKEKEEYAVSF